MPLYLVAPEKVTEMALSDLDPQIEYNDGDDSRVVEG